MDKSPDAFRTISEVAELLDTPAHVLRFWESRFPQIKPVKRAGGRRYYRPVDVDLLIGIRKLLHDEGLTIRGVQKVLREQGVRHVSGLSEEESFDEAPLSIVPAAAQRSTAPIPLFPVAKQAVAEPPALPQDVPQNEPSDSPVAAMPPEVTEDAIDLGTDLAGPAPTTQPEDDEVAEDMRKNPTTAAPDPNAPELPFDPPATRADEPLADPLAESDSPVDDDDGAGAGNIFVEAESGGDSEGKADGPEEPLAADDASESQATDVPDAASTPAEPTAPAPIVEAAPDSLPATCSLDGETVADAAPSETDAADLAIAAPDNAAPAATRLNHPLPVLDTSEIHAEWLPADLRSLRAGAFGAKQAQAAALLQRLQALRNRVGDLGRVPRR